MACMPGSTRGPSRLAPWRAAAGRSGAQPWPGHPSTDALPCNARMRGSMLLSRLAVRSTACVVCMTRTAAPPSARHGEEAEKRAKLRCRQPQRQAQCFASSADIPSSSHRAAGHFQRPMPCVPPHRQRRRNVHALQRPQVRVGEIQLRHLTARPLLPRGSGQRPSSQAATAPLARLRRLAYCTCARCARAVQGHVPTLGGAASSTV